MTGEKPEQFQFRDPELDVSGERFGFYEREFYPLSNFSSFQVEWRGKVWPTSEHAYHAAKFWGNDELVGFIAEARSAHDAFKIAQAFRSHVPPEWERLKVEIMTDICKHKLLQNPYVQKKLLETGDKPLVEDSPKDDFWGWGPTKTGRNELGKIWERLRDWWPENELLTGDSDAYPPYLPPNQRREREYWLATRSIYNPRFVIISDYSPSDIEKAYYSKEPLSFGEKLRTADMGEDEYDEGVEFKAKVHLIQFPHLETINFLLWPNDVPEGAYHYESSLPMKAEAMWVWDFEGYEREHYGTDICVSD